MEKAPPRPRRTGRSKSTERRNILKNTPPHLLPMPTKNPFSASSGSEREIEKSDNEVTAVPSNGLESVEENMKKRIEEKMNGRNERANKNVELIRKLEEQIGGKNSDSVSQIIFRSLSCTTCSKYFRVKLNFYSIISYQDFRVFKAMRIVSDHHVQFHAWPCHTSI